MDFVTVFGRLNFMVGVVAMESALCFRRKKRRRAGLKWLLCMAVIGCVSVFATVNTQWENQMVLRSVILRNIPGRFLVAALTALHMWLCYEIDLWSALFLLAVSISCQRMQYGTYKILEFAWKDGLRLPLSDIGSIYLNLGLLVVFCLITSYIFRNSWGKFDLHKENRFVVVISLVILEIDDICSLYSLANDPYANFGKVLVSQGINSLILKGLLLAMLYNLIGRRTLLLEQAAIDAINRQRDNQYSFSQELINSINVKSHDLKKQIRYLKDHAQASTKLIEDLENVTAEYDTFIFTENETLSTVLTEKSIVCKQRGIPFTCMADGRNLEFMKELDLYTLFSNLLDNAIEASCAPELEHRSIHLIVRQQAGFLSIHTENYYTGKIFLQDGLPVTTKKDRLYHGFGMRSIRQTVEQYGGTMDVDLGDHVFRVNILLPLAETQR